MAEAPHHTTPALQPPAMSAPDGAPLVPGYTLLRAIGQGGMGVVWEARDERLDRLVALKVHAGRAADARATESTWREARLAARISHPGVVAVHDVGRTLDGRPFYTMDLVEGTELGALLRDGPLPVARAIAIASEIADAVAAAHDRGIVHRDLKPSNILIDASGRARVLDFGLAVVVDDEGGAVAGARCGTPAYMSPEQVEAKPVGVAADVYAIGVILYEMLAGRVPFRAPSREELFRLVLHAPPAPPSTANPAVHTDLERVVLRCLEKHQRARFRSARALGAVLVALAEGRPLAELLAPDRASGAVRTAASLAPRAALDTEAPPRAARFHARWSWTFRLPAEKLWPLVANTDRLNEAAGLPAVQVTDTPDPRGGTLRVGQFRKLGMTVAWEEFPFEWVRNREHSVYRRYHSGPFTGLWNRVRLVPRDEGRATELVHEVWIAPRGVLGLIVAVLEVRLKFGRAVDKLYPRLAAAAARELPPEADPFERPHEPDAAQRLAVSAGAHRLREERGFSDELVARLAALLLYTPTKALERLRPYELAQRWGADRARTLELCLHAASVGLLEISWDMVCPQCWLPHESCTSLACVKRAGVCASCSCAYERDLARTVEVSFRPHPEVRRTERTTHCAGSPALRPRIVAQQRVAPGETRVVTLELPRGDYAVAGPRFARSWEFAASPAGYAADAELSLDAEGQIEARPAVVRAGEARLTLVNGTADEQLFRVERAGATEDAVLATTAMSHPTFHALFAQQGPAAGEHLAVARMAFVMVDLEEREALFARLGDAGAFDLLQRVERVVAEQARLAQGRLLAPSLGAWTAAFHTAAPAARAALALHEELRAVGVDAPVRVAVHQGPCIVVTRGERVDFFGETLERVAALLAECRPGGVALSGGAMDDYGVAAAVYDAGRGVEVAASARAPYRGRRIVRVAPPVEPRGTAGGPARRAARALPAGGDAETVQR